MYNPSLYQTVLNKSHHIYRVPFDTSLTPQIQNPALSFEERMTLRLELLFSQERPLILPGQKIVFMRTVTDLPDIYTAPEWEKIKSEHFIHELGYISNICADYASTIAVGLDARLLEVEARLARAGKEQDEKGVLFLSCLARSIRAVLGLADRYAAFARAKGLSDIADTLEHIPHKGAGTFREALQFFRILHFTLWAEGEYHNTVGRFDLFMWPYLKADLDAGRIDRKGAEELLEDFFMSFNWDSDRYTGVQLGDNGQSMMLGGVDREGKPVYNLLSELCLRTSHELKLIDPKINLRVSRDTPFDEYLEGTRLTEAGLGFPQYSNDDVVIPGLEALGYSAEDARDYTVAACWEFIIPGKGMDVVNIGALSYPKVLQEVLYRHLLSSATFEDLMERMREGVSFEASSLREKIHDLYFIPAPFYSLLMEGRVEAARDLSEGCIYNNFGFHGTGLATAVDSLSVIARYVYGDKSVSKEELLDAMKHDFSGHEDLLHKVRYESPKMGDNDDPTDEIACFLMNSFADAQIAGGKNERGGIWRAGTGSAMFYLWHAAELDASPDGRRKDEAFGTNFSPSLYVKNKGPFSVISSFTKEPVGRLINGGPLTMEFHSSVFRTADGIDQVARLVKLFVDKGGHQLQLNSINRDRLLEAQAHPENFKNLIVRIWGWSAYFVELDKAYQDHLIARQEFTD